MAALPLSWGRAPCNRKPHPVTDTKQQPAPPERVDGQPRHVAIIMDGNGRWASKHGLPRAVGHRNGVEAVRRTVRAAIELGIPYLTLYSFSSENWSRPVDEIDDLMGLMKRFIRRDLAELHQAGVKIRVIGERANVETELMTLIDEAVELTRDNQAITLIIAFNYGARAEIAKAARALAEQVAAGTMQPQDITSGALARCARHRRHPRSRSCSSAPAARCASPNFLLWQCAYTEFVFLDAYWPDFGRELLEEAIARFRERERRFGGRSKQSIM